MPSHPERGEERHEDQYVLDPLVYAHFLEDERNQTALDLEEGLKEPLAFTLPVTDFSLVVDLVDKSANTEPVTDA